MGKILLIDGNSLVFRAYHATSHSGAILTTKNGIPTNALYGFALMIQKAISKFEPDKILVAFDTQAKTFRHTLFPEYKGTRKKADDDLVIQFPLVREYLEAINVSWFEKAGIEADDIIGTMANKHPNDENVILTGDRDLLQLINSHTTVWLMKKGITEMQAIDEKTLLSEYGLSPKEVIELKGLMGDASDNIPGIHHVGEKTAMTLLAKYQTVEGVIEHQDELKGKLAEYVKSDQQLAILSKKLATIEINADFSIDDNSLNYTLDPKKAYDFYCKYEMKTFINQLNYVPTEKKVDIQAEELKQFDLTLFKEMTAVYTVYSAIIHSKGEIKGFGLVNKNGRWFFPFELAIKDGNFLNWLESDVVKIVYDVKNMYHLFAGKLNNAFDIMIASFLVNDEITDYERLVSEYSVNKMIQNEELYGKPSKPKLVDPLIECKYAAENANLLFSLYSKLLSRMNELEIYSLYQDIEMPLAKVLYLMEEEGIRVDLSTLNSLADIAADKVNKLTIEIYKLAGREFNINSPKALSEILYDNLGLPGGKKRSTAIDVLERLRPAHPVIDLIIDYRKYQKFYSTYAEGLKKYIKDDGKIHTQYNQCIVSTGRLSSTEPNLQNISVRDEENKEIRKAFVAEPGCVIMSADYAQVELRILAHMADEPLLIQTFKDNIDVHTRTAMDIFHVNKQDVDDLMRRKAKTVNFGIVYGISGFGLADRLGISRKEAEEYINNYFNSYPRVKEFMDNTIKYCEEHGYVKTLLNRRREIPEINDKEYVKREFGKRAAMNAPIQGTAADLIKLAMIKIQNELELRKKKSKMILQVHDELIFNVPEEEIEDMKQIISNGMQHAMNLKVPLIAECVWGKTWFEAE